MASTPEEGTAPEETVEELATARDGGARVVDVRSPDEYARGHVPGAENVPLEDLVDRPDQFGDQEVHLVCGGGGRSFRAACAVTSAGGRAISVAGGTRGWTASGREVEHG